MNAQNIIEFNCVTFAYFADTVIFKDLSIKLDEGVFYLIKGVSGAGKSSFFRLINRLEEPDSGEIFFKGKSVSSYRPSVLRRSILYIQQTPLAIDASVRDNLLFPFSFKSNRNLLKPADDKLMLYLDDFCLQGVSLDSNAINLSTGQLQRICFIRGLLLSPDVILLDEPTSALDKNTCSIVESMAAQMCLKYGKTVLMASHKGFESEQEYEVLELSKQTVKKRN